MRWPALIILITLLSVAGTAAIPPPPAVPSVNDLPTGPSVTLTVPMTGSTVNSTVNISFHHTATTTLNCTLTINSTGEYNRTVPKDKKVGVLLTLKNGSHAAQVTCKNGTMTPIHSPQITFTVSNEHIEAVPKPTVTLFSPKDTSAPLMVVKFQHDGPTTADCGIRIDDNPLLTKNKFIDVPAGKNQTKNITFTEDEYGEYIINVTCTGSGWSASARKKVDVSDEYEPEVEEVGGLNITPKTTFKDMPVTIKGSFDDSEKVRITITTGSKKERFNVTPSATTGIFKLVYTPKQLGTYSVTATSDFNETLNGTFKVIERDPSISIRGNKTNITQNTTFYIEGIEFFPEENVTITIIGAGTSITNKTFTDEDGAFSFEGPRSLAPRSYDITATSVTDTTFKATLRINIVAPVVANTTNTTSAGPVCGNSKAEGDEECDKGASNGACPALCSATCKLNECAAVDDPPVNNDIDDDFDYPDEPYQEPYEDPYDEPSDPIIDEPSGVNLSWIWYVIVGLVVVGGALGYFVYNGTIDVSGLPLIGNMVGASRTESHASSPAPISYSEEQTLKSFIFSERGKGFDDLTIRSSLLGKGWDKDEVDRIFDEIYKSQ